EAAAACQQRCCGAAAAGRRHREGPCEPRTDHQRPCALSRAALSTAAWCRALLRTEGKQPARVGRGACASSWGGGGAGGVYCVKYTERSAPRSPTTFRFHLSFPC
ncbi:hypothetical protein JKP88DRAFT_349296, partial [Tribonema minus]